MGESLTAVDFLWIAFFWNCILNKAAPEERLKKFQSTLEKYPLLLSYVMTNKSVLGDLSIDSEI